MKQKLATIDKHCKVLKQFEDNECCVCLSNYKEILEEDLNIVVPSCGHPLCWKCVDNIHEDENKECPRCRVKVSND